MHSLRMVASVAAAVVLISGADVSAKSKKSFIKGPIQCTHYDGVSDDLLTGGLGKTGLLGAKPAVSAPPTAAELRTLAIYNNYRALVPIDPGGGYGTLFGPNIDAAGNDSGTEGLVSGTECLAYAGNASGKQNVTMMVQVPDSFDPSAACMVTGPSSGSRGVYGAIGTAGEWGLRNGCAVVYTDKGTGTGAHNLQSNTVNLLTGERQDADVAGKASNFTAKLNDSKRADFNTATPDRFAFKHAHSERNPEADWGLNVLQSIEFAFFQLAEMCESGDLVCGEPITPANTIVIASSVSNGGGSSVRAAELDVKGLIDGVGASEPNVNPTPGGAFVIQQGAGAPLSDHSRSLYDYTTAVHAYQACASLAAANAAAPFNVAGNADRCASLHDKGLLASGNLADQADEAQAILNDEFGLLVEQNIIQPSHWALFVPQAVSVTYANAYSRAGVADNLCGYSFGATDPLTFDPVPLTLAQEEVLFGESNGIPPTTGVNVINNESPGGPKRDQNSSSPSTGRADQNLDGALCIRGLADGADPATGAPLTGPIKGVANRLGKSIQQIRADGDLNGKPAIFVTGRNDAILAPNHTSRAYYGLNQVVEGGGSNMRYYEILNAHHLDALTVLDLLFNAPLFADKFLPLHHYLFQALDLMLDHLRNGTPLPPSQVVRTVPRGLDPGAVFPFTFADVNPISEAVNLPEIDAAPDPGDLITFGGATLFIPD